MLEACAIASNNHSILTYPRVFIYTHTLLCNLCMGAVRDLVSPRICTESSEPSLFDDAIGSKISCAVKTLLALTLLS